MKGVLRASMEALARMMILLTSTARGQTVIEAGGNAIQVWFGLSAPVGPDGPWWAMNISVDYPRQFMSMLPSLSPLSLVISASACNGDPAACPSPIPPLWEPGGQQWERRRGNDTLSDLQPASSWDVRMARLLALQGGGAVFRNRVTLEGGVPEDTWKDNIFLDDTALMLSDSYTATFPGGASYTFDTGFFSLSGVDDSVSWTARNGTMLTHNSTLPGAYYVGNLPSMSYGLHVGNVAHNVTPSLVLGGYDSSRYLSSPLTARMDSLWLESLTLNVSGGDSAYLNSQHGKDTMLRRNQGGDGSVFHANLEPGLPYMYLPRATCDAIAAQIPVTYNQDYNLYFWDIEAETYNIILNSPHYMAFDFSSRGGGSAPVTIAIPFAVLNLTLVQPLVEVEISYFPCSPLEDGDEIYLGRAFLQGAYLVQNWQTASLSLAQAPGPSLAEPSIVAMATGNTSLNTIIEERSWIDTWADELRPYNRAPSGETDDRQEADGLSSGAIAGLVVGIIVGLTLVGGLVFFIIRRRHAGKFTAHSASEQAPGDFNAAQQTSHISAFEEADGRPRVEMDTAKPMHELESRSLCAELEPARSIHELSTNERL